MKRTIRYFWVLAAVTLVAAAAQAENQGQARGHWTTVVNSYDLMPPLYLRTFNSYNQPSVNARGLVVFRARSRGGPPLGPATHGIYLRDMAERGSEIVRVLDRTTLVPGPNNLETTFVETPAFPRIDMHSDTIATRGNHQPGWRFALDDGSETRAGTTGIYANPWGELLTGAAKLGHAPGFEFYSVPEFPGTPFDVFPGAPAVTGGDTIVFKGNYTVDGFAKTGVYFRRLDMAPAGGTAPAIMIANNTDSLIPGTHVVFGSTAPPNAADGYAVFAGFDDEAAPTLGGIYMAPLEYQPPLTPLVEIGTPVPGEAADAGLRLLGEGIAFDGRHVAFWGAWGDERRRVRLYCPVEGNRDRIDYCNHRLACRETAEIRGDPNTTCDDPADPEYGIRCYADREVPVRQGIFVYDTGKQALRLVAKTGERFGDFLFWHYAGKTPCAGKGHAPEGATEDGESVRWRSGAFVAVSGAPGTAFRAVFKARRGRFEAGTWHDPVDGLYLARGPGKPPLLVIADTTMRGRQLDPEAPADATVVELGVEREGLRGHWLAINAKIGIEGSEEDDGVAGIYLTRIP